MPRVIQVAGAARLGRALAAHASQIAERVTVKFFLVVLGKARMGEAPAQGLKRPRRLQDQRSELRRGKVQLARDNLHVPLVQPLQLVPAIHDALQAAKEIAEQCAARLAGRFNQHVTIWVPFSMMCYIGQGTLSLMQIKLRC
ncbi:hypothetical protein JJE66_15370 [Bradyrhizobium diazoefficiens]|uniref:hypothetical protein n=1 Tax=Bradyrhizobium diazoefficiens TaxID=1355477 RepID=UPI00190CF7AB|nr:hypothetical protein [Bradyrhizobium diazoefficiens]MBK3662616.1 hypothetical protein [Bradyrhizobium diazoefficiens]